ncbi:MAG: PilZ domain-containing protein [Candidatus Omnitrophota bacterium]
MQDRRRCHRLNIELPASYQAQGNQGSLTVASTLDLSATGICLRSRDKLHQGQKLPVQVTLPAGEKILIHVEVIWVQEIYEASPTEFKIGLKIDEPLKADESKFVRFYASQLLEFFKENPQANRPS